jgi:hypothetical protein
MPCQEEAALAGGAGSSFSQEEAHNSEDEYDSHVTGGPEQERNFEEQMAQRGLHIRQMAKDGNCLCRCVSDRVYGDADMHDVARRLCMDHMEKERDHFSQYVTQDFDAYISRKRRDGTFGNHIEMQALSEIFSRPIEVYARSEQPINTFQSSEGASSDVPPLRLSYHGRNHYNVRTLAACLPLPPPLRPTTAGLGAAALALPAGACGPRQPRCGRGAGAARPHSRLEVSSALSRTAPRRPPCTVWRLGIACVPQRTASAA